MIYQHMVEKIEKPEKMVSLSLEKLDVDGD